MRHPGVPRARSTAVGLLFASLLSAAAAVAQPTSSPAQYGRDLFSGRTRMQNGGPPCASCHSISSLGFPSGGVMGPDLSPIYQTMGAEGIDAALQTLFFPTMMPIYDKRPLTAGEQAALKAFLAQAGTTPVGERDTIVLAALGLAGCMVLLAITWLAWRGRLRGVRAPLVARVRGPQRGSRVGGTVRAGGARP